MSNVALGSSVCTCIGVISIDDVFIHNKRRRLDRRYLKFSHAQPTCPNHISFSSNRYIPFRVRRMFQCIKQVEILLNSQIVAMIKRGMKVHDGICLRFLRHVKHTYTECFNILFFSLTNITHQIE